MRFWDHRTGFNSSSIINNLYPQIFIFFILLSKLPTSLPHIYINLTLVVISPVLLLTFGSYIPDHPYHESVLSGRQRNVHVCRVKFSLISISILQHFLRQLLHVYERYILKRVENTYQPPSFQCF